MAGTRKLFEEVAEAKTEAPKPQGGMIEDGRRGAARAIRVWLMILFAMVVVMIAVGGLTRLTDSGLSITEWAPLSGAIPPLTAEDWAREFDAYRQIPEYQLQNQGMSLDEFKFIYWWEWGHRQWGRAIGVVWAVGFLGFLAFRKIPTGWTGRLFLLGVLGGLQGAIGWWMVYSGLGEGMLDVASYRLAIHLGLAFVILGLIAWFILKLGRTDVELLQARRAREGKLWTSGTGLMHLTMLQILLGALVAGIDAGRTYTDWPLMNGAFLPPDLFALEPVWRNFFEDPGLVQFMHRIAGYVIALYAILVWVRSRRSPNTRVRFGFNAVLAMLSVQIALGIVTVLYVAPWQLAILHQFGAVILWVLILRARFNAGYPPAQSVRA
ncbi:MAG: heme A synthase [Pseudomonadota bacterium]